MTVFDILKSIASKKGNREELLMLVRGKAVAYSPFLINRWLSFLNPTIAGLLNTYCNRGFPEQDEHLLTLYSLLPKSVLPSSMPHIKYVKRPKEEKEEEIDQKAIILAQNLEISQKEAKICWPLSEDG
jgi:hypothetical protein